MSKVTSETTTVPARTPKGQAFHTWKDQTDWIEVPERKLRYKQVPFGEEGNESWGLMVRYDPGSEVGVHFHPADYCSIVVEGSVEITRKLHEVGSVRIVKAGTAYGPLKVGPEGCTVIDVFAAGPQGITYLSQD